MGISKAVKRDQKTQLIAGITKHFGKVKTITLKGNVVKIADLVSGIQASIDAGADTDTKRTAYLEAAKTSRSADEASDPDVVAFTEFVQSTLSATDLADFGLKPKTRAVPDVATKALANAKRAATRKARGTMGKKEKAKIVGVVSDDVAGPAAAAAAPAVVAGAAPKTTGTSSN
jgi:hypothetical protein